MNTKEEIQNRIKYLGNKIFNLSMKDIQTNKKFEIDKVWNKELHELLNKLDTM